MFSTINPPSKRVLEGGSFFFGNQAAIAIRVRPCSFASLVFTSFAFLQVGVSHCLKPCFWHSGLRRSWHRSVVLDLPWRYPVILAVSSFRSCGFAPPVFTGFAFQRQPGCPGPLWTL